ncbi:MAG: PQQ-binding-like beta-propeller repeat protein [bacterium]|jgi:outer membrane protein assembly factor BamB|nr:PQQ-binding-like beta-propeller repeat protein [bacterium]
MHKYRILLFYIALAGCIHAQQRFTLINPTYLGGEKRNYYGNVAPEKLDILWKCDLGRGITRISGKERVWKGSGWTGQVLMYREAGKDWLIHGGLDHHLRKIDAENGTVIWTYEFPDAIKGTGTLWAYESGGEERLLVIQGSRRDTRYNTWYARNYPLRAVDAENGKERWRYPVLRDRSYSVDADASALIYNELVYIGLENGKGVVFDPHPDNTESREDFRVPRTRETFPLYHENDQRRQGQNLVTESSPARLGERIYFTAGSGHVYGYHLEKKEIDWDFFVGTDMDGSPVVTADSCLLISVEKEYNPGFGGVMKIDPSGPADSSCVRWFFPTGNDSGAGALWAGGVIGSPAVNDITRPSRIPPLAGFTGIDGYFYLVRHDLCDTLRVWGPNRQYRYLKPKLLAKRWAGQSISTPLFVGDKIIVASYSGILLFRYDPERGLELLERRDIGDVESTPFVFNKRIYVGSKDGYLYCLGEK